DGPRRARRRAARGHRGLRDGQPPLRREGAGPRGRAHGDHRRPRRAARRGRRPAARGRRLSRRDARHPRARAGRGPARRRPRGHAAVRLLHGDAAALRVLGGARGRGGPGAPGGRGPPAARPGAEPPAHRLERGPLDPPVAHLPGPPRPELPLSRAHVRAASHPSRGRARHRRLRRGVRHRGGGGSGVGRAVTSREVLRPRPGAARQLRGPVRGGARV
ncbi:MAG: Imidazole glycerol phosphate synthase amidotransferase subunit, partial [uncultured Solirubrobacteraceae bacterium]